MALLKSRKEKFDNSAELGGSEPLMIIGIVFAFGVLYYGAFWVLDFVQGVKQDRKIARGFDHRSVDDGNGPHYMSDLY